MNTTVLDQIVLDQMSFTTPCCQCTDGEPQQHQPQSVEPWIHPADAAPAAGDHCDLAGFD